MGAFLAAVLLLCSGAVASPPLIGGIHLAGSNVRLTISSDLGATNRIETATSLDQINWTLLTTVVVTQSPYDFTDSPGPASPRKFYRVVASSGAGPALPPNMVLIPAGAFDMGDTFYEGFVWELPIHTVNVSAFYLDKYEVTKALWNQVQAWSLAHGYSYDNPGSGKGTNHPVHSLNWYDMVKWCNARSEMDGRKPCYYTDAALTQVYRTGQAAPYVDWNAGFRLPTEAEWERADRGGVSGHRFPWSDSDTISHSRANYYSDPSAYSYDVSPTSGYHPAFADGVFPYTSPVGSFAPNAYGLYDMAGNVWEWCWDWSGNYTTDPQTDPRGPASGSARVGRGGNWDYFPEHCRAAYRYGNSPDYIATNIGFRCAMSAP